MNLGPEYDHWKIYGCSHRCECGSIWTDSDGGPCHEECKACGELTHIDELEDDTCKTCISIMEEE